MYKMTADGIVGWKTEQAAMRILVNAGYTIASAEATLKAMRGMGRDYYAAA